MKSYFNVEFLKEADEFLFKQDEKVRYKILYNIDKARYTLAPELFKKLTEVIWEFRTKYSKIQYRLLAFWDKTAKKNSLVICTHGIIKKSRKISKSEIEKAEKIRNLYFMLKGKNHERK